MRTLRERRKVLLAGRIRTQRYRSTDAARPTTDALVVVRPC